MKVKFLIGGFLLFSLFACEKDDNDAIEPSIETPNYFPKTTDSYWVYNTYEIDSLGNEVLISENDTVRVTGDTIINGFEYKVFLGKNYFSSTVLSEKFYRDSAEFVISSDGSKVFSQENFTDTLFSEPIPNIQDTLFFRFSKMEIYLEELSLPMGIIDSLLNAKLTFIYWKSEEKLVANLNYLYAPNMGRIVRQYTYASGFYESRKYYEERLVDFYIEKD